MGHMPFALMKNRCPTGRNCGTAVLLNDESATTLANSFCGVEGREEVVVKPPSRTSLCGQIESRTFLHRFMEEERGWIEHIGRGNCVRL